MIYINLNENDVIHCLKYKKKTKNVNLKVVHTNNGLYRIAAKYSICKINKSKFIKNPVGETKSDIKKKFTKKDSIIEVEEIHAPLRRKFPKRKIITLGICDLWAADLVIASNYSNENDDYKYMLNVVDAFSKYAWSKPVRKKNRIEVSKTFKEISKDAIKIGHKLLNLLHTDKGLEFKNKVF